MSLSDLKMAECKCGSPISMILQNIETRKWHVQCYVCRKTTPQCKTKKNAILAWNGMNRKETL